MKLNLGFLLQPPDLSARAMLTIDVLAPLSMVASMPGKYYRSQPSPSHEMLYGMLENALGWHVSARERNEMKNRLQQRHGTAKQSGVGFISLLQYHLRFATEFVPTLMRYDDLWSQHLKHTDRRHIDGSRNHDYRAIPILNEIKAGKRELKAPEIIKYFPQYYISPTPREYVVPSGAYKYRVETLPELSELIEAALQNPAAPLYLGSNDGWVEAKWEIL